VVHLRKGIHWQDVPPVNGREFTAYDVAYHYHRLWGLGSDLTPSPDHAKVPAYRNLLSVTATDRYTAVFKWKTPNPELIMMSLLAPNPAQVFEAREAVEEWGDLSDWHHAIGTGPFILKDFVSGSSATLIKNPNYWGYDERYPQNKLPYADTIKFLIIPDNNKAFALMRAGKIDLVTPVSLQDAQSMQKTNPEILQIPIPFPATISLDPRIDKTPFNDIRVRKAMQMAIDLPAIAKDYYHGAVEPYPAALSSRNMKKGGFPYEEWPQDLKEEYAYNPTLAKKFLADAGYPNGFKTNIVADAVCDMDLLQIVKSYFAQVGIDMEIRPMDSASWNDFVLQGHKHDQLAQRSTVSFGYEYEPVRLLHGLQTGHPTHQMISDPVCDALYPKALAATSLDEVLRIYRDANEYFARQHFIISLLQPKTFALCQPWLKGYSAQFGSLTGPAVLSFYLGRFWIDKNLKKSMGH
jgi:ABC-type transport system substrate-binding protein